MPTRREKLQLMLKDNPQDAFLAYGLAIEILKEGDSAGAIEQFEKVIADHPDYQAAYFQLGQSLANLGRVDDARRTVEAGLLAARRIGDDHAAAEMEGFLLTLS
ncbi:tetratricopeptide repeat protein [bacterium]|jgi:Flp pilus assembly protein TadD|nr:tetratricopeptide repeat protein [bacterium]